MVPDGEGGAPQWTELSIEERCQRLESVLQYAASRADHYKALVARMTLELAMAFHIDLPNNGVKIDKRATSLLKDLKELASAPDISTDTDSNGGDVARELEAAKNRLREAEAERDRLQEALDERVESQSNGTRAEDEFETLRAELETLREERDKAKEQRRLMADEVESLRTELEALSYDRDEAFAQRQSTAEQFAMLRQDHDAAMAERDALEVRCNDLSSSLDAFRAELDAKQEGRAASDAHTQTLQDDLDAIRQELDEVRITKERLETDYARALEEADLTKTKLADVEKLVGESDARQQTIFKLSDELDALRHAKSEMEERIQELEARNSELSDTLDRQKADYEDRAEKAAEFDQPAAAEPPQTEPDQSTNWELVSAASSEDESETNSNGGAMIESEESQSEDHQEYDSAIDTERSEDGIVASYLRFLNTNR